MSKVRIPKKKLKEFGEAELVMIAKAIECAKWAFEEFLEQEEGIDPAYYPIHIVVYRASEDFSSYKKILEVDEREFNEGRSVEKRVQE